MWLWVLYREGTKRERRKENTVSYVYRPNYDKKKQKTRTSTSTSAKTTPLPLSPLPQTNPSVVPPHPNKRTTEQTQHEAHPETSEQSSLGCGPRFHRAFITTLRMALEEHATNTDKAYSEAEAH